MTKEDSAPNKNAIIISINKVDKNDYHDKRGQSKDSLTSFQ
jgi:hypothetical protein